MQGKPLFIISLIAIIALSWVNVDYFGTSRTELFSPAVNQAVHIAAFMLTGIIGYINWLKKDKWVGNLWIGLYVLALVIFAGSFVVFHFTGSQLVKRIGAGFRNHFTEPLPFLVFYVFIAITQQLSKGREV